MRLIVSFIFLFTFSFHLSSHPLGDAAAQMSAQSWRPIQTQGLTIDLLRTSRGGGLNAIFSYSINGNWDPKSEQIMYLGSPPKTSPWRFILYDAPTNTWRKGPLHSAIYAAHSYDNQTLIPETGELYFWPKHHPLLKYDVAKDTWSSVSEGGESNNVPGGYGGALEYFPEMNALIYAYSGKVMKFDLSNNNWSTMASGWTQYAYAQYNPVHKFMMLTKNGSGEIYKMNASGNISKITSAPFGIHWESCLMTCDPVSGDFLFLTKESFHSYDPVANKWSTGAANPVGAVSEGALIPISTYGVVAFVSNYRWPVLLYKHAGGKTGVEQKSLSKTPSSLNVWPNPARGAVSFQFSDVRKKAPSLSILDLSGKVVKTLKAKSRDQTVRMDARVLAPGVYLAKFGKGQKKKTTRLTILP